MLVDRCSTSGSNVDKPRQQTNIIKKRERKEKRERESESESESERGGTGSSKVEDEGAQGDAFEERVVPDGPPVPLLRRTKKREKERATIW
jgi:hypothetical protein